MKEGSSRFSRRSFLEYATAMGAGIRVDLDLTDEQVHLGRHLTRAEIDKKLNGPQQYDIPFTPLPTEDGSYLTASFKVPTDAYIYGSLITNPTDDPNEVRDDMLLVTNRNQETGLQQNWGVYAPLIADYYPQPSNFQFGHYPEGSYTLNISPATDHTYATPDNIFLSLKYGVPNSWTDELNRYAPLIKPIDWDDLETKALEKFYGKPRGGDLRHNSLIDLFVIPYEKGGKYMGREQAEDFRKNADKLIEEDGRPDDVDPITIVSFGKNAYTNQAVDINYYNQGRFDKIRPYTSTLVEETRPKVQFQYPNNTVAAVDADESYLEPFLLYSGPYFAPSASIMTPDEFESQIDDMARWEYWILAFQDLGIPVDDALIKKLKQEHRLPSDYTLSK